jgi:hypothetical protein
MRQQLLAPVEERTARTISTYANERGFKVVLDASALRDGLAYVHDTADITTEIMRRLVADMRKSDPSGTRIGGLPKPDKTMERVFQRDGLMETPIFQKATLMVRQALASLPDESRQRPCCRRRPINDKC